jgi:hypothetical protein
MANTRIEPGSEPSATRGAQQGTEGSTEAPMAGTQAAMEKASQVSGEVRRQADSLADDVKSEAQQLLARTKEEIGNEASSRTSQFAATLHDVANELRTMAEADRDGRLHGLADGAAERADRFASQLDTRGFDGMVDELKRSVRRRPGVVLAVAAGAGFVVGRLVRDAGQAQANRASNFEQQRPGGPNGSATIDLTRDERARAAAERLEGMGHV